MAALPSGGPELLRQPRLLMTCGEGLLRQDLAREASPPPRRPLHRGPRGGGSMTPRRVIGAAAFQGLTGASGGRGVMRSSWATRQRGSSGHPWKIYLPVDGPAMRVLR